MDGWDIFNIILAAIMCIGVLRWPDPLFGRRKDYDFDDEEEPPKPPKKPAVRVPTKSQNADSTLFDADDSHAVHLSEAPEDPLADTPAEPKKEGETPWDIYVRQQQKQKPL